MAQPEPSAFPRGLALVVAGALFMEILDATVIATAIPAMAESLGVDAVDLNVAISAYLVTLAVLIPVSGWVAERFGVRRVFLTARTPLMRRFGIRGVLLSVGVATVVCFGALALLVPATPLALIALALFVSGALRSIGFTGYNSLAFADVGSSELTDANTLHATAQELFSGVGIAVGAIALTVSAGIVADLGWTPGHEYSPAFVVLGAVMLAIVWGAWRLPRDAGVAVTG